MVTPVTNTDLGSNKYKVNLGFVIGPRAKLHGAVLVVKGEVGDVHRAGGLEYRWRNPRDGAIKFKQSLGLILHQEITYSTANEKCMFVSRHNQEKSKCVFVQMMGS